MGGLFGVVSKQNCIYDVFFGTDYHSHLGTKRAGIAIYDSVKGYDRAIHNIEKNPFRSKFESDIENMSGNIGIGCISDSDPQPLIVRSHIGSYAIATVGLINNADKLVEQAYKNGVPHFLEMSGGKINATELVAALINEKDSLLEGISFAQDVIEGSLTFLVMTDEGIYCARDRLGRTPLIIGKKEDAYCVAFESFSFLNLGYDPCKELGPCEVVFLSADGIKTLREPGKEMRICTFLWIYYGYPTSTYEGVNVECMRYECGRRLAMRDNIRPDSVAGVPDSGTAHAIGYSNGSQVPFVRPFIKYTPTWPRSFMPPKQIDRNLIAKMKLIPVHKLIKGKRLMLIDDSIVRGTQMRETTEFLYHSGATEVHVRPACPPLLYGCKYINFSRSNSEMDLITRRVIQRLEGDDYESKLAEYADPDSEKYATMVNEICKELKFTSLRFHRLDDMIESVGIEPCKLCTYCWNGKE